MKVLTPILSFCKREKISRQTVYNKSKKNLIIIIVVQKKAYVLEEIAERVTFRASMLKKLFKQFRAEIKTNEKTIEDLSFQKSILKR